MGKLRISNLHKSFDKLEVINNVSLEVEQGEFIVFVGPSGCGKSTLLRMIAGLEEITKGDIDIDGTIVNDLPPVKRNISMVFQSYALYPHMSVFENIAFPLRVQKLSQDEVTKRVHAAADILQLHERLHHKPGELSGGQRQRVAIGRAIVRSPSVFLFDEPLSNLDAALRAEMRVELSKLHEKLGATMIYVTHDQIEAMTMADRIVVLNGGVIAQVGSPLELYHKPANEFVATFIGNPKMNLIPVTCTEVGANTITVSLPDGNTATLPMQGDASLKGSTMKLGIRPEHMSQSEGEVEVSLTPYVVERLGIHTVAYASLAGVEGSFCALLPGETSVASGKAQTLRFQAQNCHLFTSNGEAIPRQIPDHLMYPVDLPQMEPA
ncbi:ABC transporter ATP-binding protein [Polycladidibacter hongkongensis]|uniref:ABC transporter ATP-binding protein n=1 Tax=Polycladidibacter hongkongensis TaxID=1647556 RepID=UPI000831C0C8|nr:sn-glycerol-3-phosphate ABC transporter ATP-binding protein UgpC [Pseudovibrio hongkongensis]